MSEVWSRTEGNRNIVLEESGKYAIDYGDPVLRDGVQSVSILPNILG